MANKHGDRIWQLYDGEFGETGRRQARERIHWICGQVRGTEVLDVGCSQGICDVLLGREGFHVTGVDLDEAAIAFAQEKLSHESESTQARVSFLRENFMDFSAGEQRYDTIILTEILEHLLHPETLLEKAAGLLKEGGRFIVSVPFGINDWPDHKRTYYLSELLGQLSPHAAVSQIEFFTQWVACVAVRGGTDRIPMDARLLAREEEAFYRLERPLRDQLKDSMQTAAQQSEQLKQQAVSLKESQSKCVSLEEQLRDSAYRLEQQFKDNRRQLAEKDAQLAQAEETIAARDAQLEQVNQTAYCQKKELQWTLEHSEEKYKELAASKLGRVQLAVWRRRSNRRHRPPLSARLEALAKRSPLLVAAVRTVRGQGEEAKQALQGKKLQAEKDAVPASPPDTGWYDRIRAMVEQMPESNGSRYYSKLSPRIGWITDQILYDSFKSAADGILLTPDNWEASLDRIDWLFIISGWHGMEQEWNGFAREGSPKRQIIYRIIDVCKQRGLPTVFYSVEDPPNYDRFIGIARRCDHVFTATVEMLPRYREDCGHDRVHQLCYGIDPLLHNPIGFQKFPKQPEVFFAGSWMDKYPERGQDLKILFDGVLSAGRPLKIVDRNLLLNKEEYRFPNQYSAYLSPPLEHGVLQKVHKLYDWAININSVKNSGTMFANRTYELQAMGCLMLSNYSVGVNSLLPGIFTCQHSEEIPSILQSFTPEELYERQVAGIRRSMHGNTCFERVAEILNIVGIPVSLPQHKAAVVMPTDDAALRQAFERQTYPWREVVAPKELPDRYQEFDVIAFFRPGAVYGDFYLEDMINGFKYTDSDYITKAGYYAGDRYIAGPEHDYVSTMPDKYRTVFWADAFQAEQLLAWQGSVPLPNGYSIDRFMYSDGPRAKTPAPEKYDLSVIVPVYNNGAHLYGKAFNSLRRSSIFSQMEILLVDDGSTDADTLAVVRSLSAAYPNVRMYSFGDGGSGSASRPRNKGVEMATAEYLTFLDPDNEAVNDAYAKLLQTAQKGDYDVVVGNMARFRLKEELANYYYYFKKYCGTDEITGDKKEFLRRILFTPMSIQAMVIRRSVITQNGLSQVVGAVGQDSFFSWQLFVSAGRIKAVPLVAHIYYAMVQNSTVNSVGVKYFQRSLLQEQVQRDWLKEVGLLDAYMSERFTAFFRDWYLKKLGEARQGQEEQCAACVYDIFRVYQDVYHDSDPKIRQFVERMKNMPDE